MSESREILRKYWGHTGFRPLQEDIIHSVLQRFDTLALLPTGGGKSICFQVPALQLDGVCIVVTPLVALMIDQVENLQKRNIPAIAIHSGMHAREISLAFEKSINGKVKFLYVSPERLETRQFIDSLRYMPVCLLAVDEAHCISQWGYDFRPPYLKIAEIRKLLPNIPVLALTATATPDVVEDIQNRLQFQKRNVFQKSFNRENLAYHILPEEDKMGRLVKLCKNNQEGVGVVYVRNRRLTQEISEYLNYFGVPSTFYHAGLDSVTRNHRQQEWMAEKKRIIVATNAFGMGIDKPNVRFVVHLDLPDTLEAYFQEAGRAGRDEKKSFAVMLVQPNDFVQARRNFDFAWPDLEFIRNVYQALGNHLQIPVGSGMDVSYDFELAQFSRNYNFSSVLAFNSLKLLEREGYLMLSEALNTPSRILFLSGKEELYRFQLAHVKYDSLIRSLLRSHQGIFTEFCTIYESEIGRKTNRTANEVEKELTELKKLGILEYIPRKQTPQITYTFERIATKDLTLSPEVYSNRKKEAEKRLQQVLDYAQSTTLCRNQQLLAYFGETQSAPCGRCDVCLEKAKKKLSASEYKEIEESILNFLKTNQGNLGNFLSKLSHSEEESHLKAIRMLLDDGKIGRSEDGTYFVK